MTSWLAHPITVGDVLLSMLAVWVMVAVWTVVREARRHWDESKAFHDRGDVLDEPLPRPGPPVPPPSITSGTLDDWRKALRR